MNTSHLREDLERLTLGESMTIVTSLALGDTQAATKLIRKISSKVSIMGLGRTYSYQSFNALTSKVLLIVGVIVTRES